MSYDSRSYASYSTSSTSNSFYKRRTDDNSQKKKPLVEQPKSTLTPPSRHDGTQEINKQTAVEISILSAADETKLTSTRRRMMTSSTSSRIGKKAQHESNGSESSSLQRDSKGKPIHQKSGRWSFNTSRVEIPVAVLFWYILGVLSISTTKVLLSDYEHVGITPLFITVQQLLIGLFFLRLWIFFKNKAPSYPISFVKIASLPKADSDNLGYGKLFISATFFSLGFWLTNLSFSGADASFVETIKASEPISSASLAVWYGLERMSSKEVYSLVGICVGVVVSTLGNAHGDVSVGGDPGNITALIHAAASSGIVLGANLCFSFRGLYQKLFRQSPDGSKALVDDLNLQYRVHQMGLVVMILPFLYQLPSCIQLWLHHSAVGLMSRMELQKFVVLIVVNGFAFTHYNLASSYILSRVSVVYHAALNCIRRLFAIVITSIVFSVPITMVSGSGIFVSIVGFLLYTKFKVDRNENALSPKSILPS